MTNHQPGAADGGTTAGSGAPDRPAAQPVASRPPAPDPAGTLVRRDARLPDGRAIAYYTYPES